VLALAGCASSRHRHRGEDHRPRWHPPVNMLLRYDFNHDGSITRSEMEQGLLADFDAADTNHDGRLEPGEVRAVNEMRWRRDASTTSPLVDWNHDGVVDFDEFAATPRSLFDQLDTDGNGILSPKELNPPQKRSGTEHRSGGHKAGGRHRGGDGDGDGD
jgi:Ca2+-binding EF-hand superfamily protein